MCRQHGLQPSSMAAITSSTTWEHGHMCGEKYVLVSRSQDNLVEIAVESTLLYCPWGLAPMVSYVRAYRWASIVVCDDGECTRCGYRRESQGGRTDGSRPALGLRQADRLKPGTGARLQETSLSCKWVGHAQMYVCAELALSGRRVPSPNL